MKQHIKQWIKKGLTDRQYRKYEKLLEKKTVSYDAWIKEAEKVWLAEEEAEKVSKKKHAGSRREENGYGAACDVRLRQVPYSACRDYVMGNVLESDTAKVILFAEDDGKVSEIAKRVVFEFFDSHKEVMLAYADEDVMSPEGIRYTPWLKPHWSPDTFLSFFYFGSIFAVRTQALQALTQEEKQWIWAVKESEAIYRLCYVLAEKSGGFARRQEEFPVGHMDEVLFHSRMNREMKLENGSSLAAYEDVAVYENMAVDKDMAADEDVAAADGEAVKVSVIIPSKDHPEILKRCISSLQRAVECERQSAPFPYEVIVVDNGSRQPVKEELENWLGKQGSAFRYIYQPMPFHFSKMCNLGAEAAGGKVLLFLNDDVEIPKKEFLSVLYQSAIRPFTGAVGVKLYYPDSQRIQHAGIVNLQLGPVHKLQFKEDDQSYYYGWNRRRRNVIAVTGACLAVEKEKFAEIGGFAEALPVAFNDVDLCFSLYEKGYYNVVLQDVFLFHHESLSRGNDDDREKLNRLLGEKDKLYERHPKLCGNDPFYHKYFAKDMLSTGFELQADYAGKAQAADGRMPKEKGLLTHAREDACVMISLEYAGKVNGYQQSRQNYFLQGYSFVAGSDNACFESYLIFRQDAEAEDSHLSDADAMIWYVKAEPFIRKDVENNLPDQVHVGMTGFCMEFEQGALPAGSYRVGVMVKDKCSGQKLYSWTNRYLEVE